MFEGLVRQLLLGYLGRYIKDFQKEQLKITFWNEEVLLENVELILKAFDCLQLPVALKRDAVEKRELAAKKAKLVAAELAKLSRRVSDNQAGQSLISHVTGRILDSIQVTMRNVHILYSEIQPYAMLFGLKFSNLMISKQSLIGPSTSKGKGGQMTKSVEISGLGIYCNTYQESSDVMGSNGDETSQSWVVVQNDCG
ncbi:hypothetical protein RND81_01G164300 [Saponaria officinalis]|uniref:Uncharacterized protein n=1 Tax=Saponaria officinalis TaxID=3572 RepID=A0AAW1NGG2_SAPOF